MKINAMWLLTLLLYMGQLVFPEIQIITNPTNPLSILNKKDIQDIFTGKKSQWDNDGKIIIAILEDSQTHREFVQHFIKKTPAQFRNYWRQKVFSGEGMIPKTFKTEESLIAFVAETKGAVGYISSTTEKQVKIIPISDKQGRGDHP